jgi:hypothetical protein
MRYTTPAQRSTAKLSDVIVPWWPDANHEINALRSWTRD